MVPRIDDYIDEMGNSAAERRLASLLRNQPEEDRLLFVQQLIATGRTKCFWAALRLIKSCLKDRTSLRTILDQGLREADASLIADWIEAVIAGLGFRKVLDVLAKRVESDPESVIKARYWLPKWMSTGNQSDIDSVHNLDELIGRRIKGDPRLQTWFCSVLGLPQGNGNPAHDPLS